MPSPASNPVSGSASRRLDDPERRLLRAIGVVVSEKGYAAATIADIVRVAQASKTTFYQHFDTKLDLFLASYRRGNALLVRRMIAAGPAIIT